MSALFGTGRAAQPSLSPADAQAKKQQIMTEVTNQLALANAQELITKVNEKCFARCITKPAATATPNDEACLMRCTDRYLEAFNLISQTAFVPHILRELDDHAATMPIWVINLSPFISCWCGCLPTHAETRRAEDLVERNRLLDRRWWYKIRAEDGYEEQRDPEEQV
ncbi:hypothetical protein JCM10212_003086 [Sporobolomyces blumeae]